MDFKIFEGVIYIATRRVSLYQVCQTYFGKESKSSLKQKQNFGRSISSTESVLKRIFEAKSLFPIDEYLDQERKYVLASGFLLHLQGIATSYDHFFDRFELKEYYCSAQTPGCQFNRVVIKGLYLFDKVENSMIIPAYGASDNPIMEFSIFLTLDQYFSNIALSATIGTFHYWDFSKAEIQSVAKSELKEISDEALRPIFIKLAS